MTKFISITILILSLLQYCDAFNARTSTSRTQSRLTIEMKGKGKKVPIDQRGEYIKRQRMMEAQAEIERNKPKGVPIFKIFVRPKAGGLWIPCGDLAGDQRATALVNAWLSGFMTDMYRGQLDQGIARSIFNQEDSFVKGITENFKPFKKLTKDDLQFGYKIEFEGVEEKMGELPVTPIVRGMEKNWIDKAKESFGGIFGGGGGNDETPSTA